MKTEEIIDIIIPNRTGEEPLFSNYIGCANAPHIVYKAYQIDGYKIDVDVSRVYHADDIIMDIPEEALTKRPDKNTKNKNILKRVKVGRNIVEGVKLIEQAFLKQHVRGLYDRSLYGE